MKSHGLKAGLIMIADYLIHIKAVDGLVLAGGLLSMLLLLVLIFLASVGIVMG